METIGENTTKSVPSSEISTDEKRKYLRTWALEQAAGDVAKLPVIREAKAEIKRHFGDVPGAGLGTDIITKILRELRLEMMTPNAPAPNDKFARLALLVEMMAEENIQSLEIDSNGELVAMKKFSLLNS